MLDLVQPVTERIDSRFLEPACGTGNFLVEVLRRKLAVVTRRFAKSEKQWELNAVVAVSSLYGVDILLDNVVECRTRLLGVFTDLYNQQLPSAENASACLRAVRHIISHNILWGDALTLKTPDVAATPIRFAQWSVIPEKRLKRRDFTMANLLANAPMPDGTLFSGVGAESLIPRAVEDYPPVYFLDLGAAEAPRPPDFSAPDADDNSLAPGL